MSYNSSANWKLSRRKTSGWRRRSTVCRTEGRGCGIGTHSGGRRRLFPAGGRINVVFSKSSEQVVGFFFFEERKLEDLFYFVIIKGPGVLGEAAVTGDLVMLQFLDGDNEAGV